MARFVGIHLTFTLFDKSGLILREQLLHLRAAEGWIPTGALAKPRAPLPLPKNATASVSFYAGGELRATLSSFEASLNAVGGLELRYKTRSGGDSPARFTIHARHRDPERFEAFVHGRIDDAFVRSILLDGQAAV